MVRRKRTPSGLDMTTGPGSALRATRVELLVVKHTRQHTMSQSNLF